MGSGAAGASTIYRELAARPRPELEQLFTVGEAPAISSLVGYEYRGYNHARVTSALKIRKFVNAFFVGDGGEALGCHTPVRQDGLGRDWTALPDDAQPRRFAFFAVAPVEPAPRDNAHRHAILLDYGRGGNRRSDVARLLRDYLVRVEKGSDELLLGKAYLALGPARAPLGFFLLEHHRPLPADARLNAPAARSGDR